MSRLARVVMDSIRTAGSARAADAETKHDPENGQFTSSGEGASHHAAVSRYHKNEMIGGATKPHHLERNAAHQSAASAHTTAANAFRRKADNAPELSRTAHAATNHAEEVRKRTDRITERQMRRQ